MGTKSHWKQNGLYFKSGAVGDESVSATTAASTGVANYGVSLFNTKAAATYTLNAPLLGSRKTVIVADTTFTQKIKTGGATINESSAADVISVALTTATKISGFAVELYGASTSMWYMAGSAVDLATSQIAVTVTSAT